jgi:hypothetical protein
VSDNFGICALCEASAELRQSHIIPAFAFRWLKSRSVTKFLRSAKNPNVRVQDGDKVRLLCGNCELLFSGYESRFNADILKKIASSQNVIVYGDWLLKFCVSLSWRVLMHCKGRNPNAFYTDEQQRLCVEAAVRWKAFLLGQAPHPAQFCQHFLIFTELQQPPVAGMPNNMNRYLQGGVEMDVVGSETSLMTFAKIGPIVTFGVIQSPEEEWRRTKLQVRGGTLKPGHFSLPLSLEPFFFDRARMVSDTYKKMSDTQHQKVRGEYTSSILEEPGRFAESHHGRAILADARMFGEDAILDKRL